MQEANRQLSDRQFKSIAELIEGQVGIRLPHAKRLMLEGRLFKRVRALKFDGVGEYVDHLSDEDALETELTHLIDVVTTNKTDFFREPQHFDFMRKVAVPDLLRQHGRKSRDLKIWSSACSTGMEAYTIAMVLDDMIRTGSRFHFRILGTDISTAVLRVAAAAIYNRDTIEPVPEEFAKRYFLKPRDRQRTEVRVVPELRRLAHFMRMNLMDNAYPVDRDVDIIFCRNVLIYFDRETQRRVVQRLASHLRPGGYLLVGHSESMIHSALPELRQVQPTIFKI
ncbi:protein-glutamate O-methyltransferase CheR [Rhodopseudomonas sp. B29]|uniref:CheR family methyltransferase n=1 Tax=Rhodopseudomonas sp. B29 TaxID=95607 RepID=UPI0003467E92|nr:CheR family methyltransferase [Rhodopseudomonas sp. B29]